MVRDTGSPAKNEQLPSARLMAMYGSCILADTIAGRPSFDDIDWIILPSFRISLILLDRKPKLTRIKQIDLGGRDMDHTRPLKERRGINRDTSYTTNLLRIDL